VEEREKGNDSPPQYEREARTLQGLPSKMKGVVQPVPDLQMFVGRGQVEKEGLPYLLALPPPRGRAFSFPVITRGGKDFFPSGYRGKTDKFGTQPVPSPYQITLFQGGDLP
jgi:hypothetical protein